MDFDDDFIWASTALKIEAKQIKCNGQTERRRDKKKKDENHKTDATHKTAEKNKKAAKAKKAKKDKKATKTKHAKKAKKDKKNKTMTNYEKKAETSKTAADHSKSADVDFADAVVKRARRAKNEDTPCNESDAKPGDCIRVGSDCTGYGSDFLSLMLLGVNAVLVFVAEKDALKRELMKATHRGDVDFSKVIMYHDITKRDCNLAPYVDVFFTSAPCQPFSPAGRNEGLEDSQHRGVVIFHSVDYVQCKRPRLVVIENVKGLSQGKNKKILERILNALRDLGYTVEWKILNTKDSCIPQSRPRLYIVGIRSRHLVSSIEFPCCLRQSPLLESFIDIDDVRPATDRPTTTTFQLALAKAREVFGDRKCNESLVVVDTGATEQFSTVMEGCMPCITKSRGRPWQPCVCHAASFEFHC
jgi:DNA-cytosine methyltransferase